MSPRAYLFAACLAMLVAGCALPGRPTRPPKPAEGSAQAGRVALTQTGTAETPATARSIATAETIPIPAGSTVSIDTSGTVTITPAAPTTYTAARSDDSATGPQSFTPPAAPTPADEAEGRARLLYRLAIAAGGVAFLFGLIRGWDFVAWGGAALSGGAALGLFMQHPLALALVGGGMAFALAGVLLWHLVLKPRQAAASATTAGT